MVTQPALTQAIAHVRRDGFGLSRRSVLRGVLTGTAASLLRQTNSLAEDTQYRPSPRLAVMTRWIAETMFGMGVVPIALPELHPSNKMWRGLSIPRGVHDLGMAGEPNLELLSRLKVDLVLLDGRLQGTFLSRFDGIAPVVPAEIYTEDRSPLELAERETKRLGRVVSAEDRANRLVALAQDSIQQSALKLERGPKSPIFVARLLDDRNVTLYCGGSIFHDVLIRLGIPPASAISNNWGFLTTGIERLASVPDARIVYFETVPKEAQRLFTQPSLWSHLPSVRKGLTTTIPEFYSWGALPTAQRFAAALAEILPREGAG